MQFKIEAEPYRDDSLLLILARPLQADECAALNALCEEDASADYYANGENGDSRERIACEAFKLDALCQWLNGLDIGII